MAMSSRKQSSLFGILAIVVSAIIAYSFFYGYCRHMSVTAPHSQLGNLYHGGFIIPILITMLLLVITLSFERLITIFKAKGSGSVEGFLAKIKTHLANDNVNAALEECKKQKGSVANVVHSGLEKYKEMENNSELATEEKVLSINKEIEEATTLEMPILEKNLWIIATIATIGTLVALLGTVLGMIKSFQAMATAGSPDPVKLSLGISEALYNTALGIGTSAIAVVAYSFFTTRIDKLTYAIDEIGFSISQTFATKKK